MTTVNYSSLKKETRIPLAVYFISGAFLLIFISIIMLANGNSMVMLGLNILSIAGIWKFIITNNKKYELAFEKFIADNEWEYKNNQKLPTITVFGEKLNSVTTLGNGNFGKTKFWINKVNFLNNKNQNTAEMIEIRLQCVKPIKEFLIFPDYAAWFLETFLQYVNFDEFEEVHLEGDFDKNYRLYTKKGEHIDAMSFVTPDVMATIEETDKAMAIFATSGVCSIFPGDVSDFKLSYDSFAPLMEFSERIAKELSDKYSY